MAREISELETTAAMPTLSSQSLTQGPGGQHQEVYTRGPWHTGAQGRSLAPKAVGLISGEPDSELRREDAGGRARCVDKLGMRVTDPGAHRP